MDRLEHLSYQLHFGAGRNREYIAVEVDGTPLVFGVREHLAHSLQPSEALIANDQLHSAQTPAPKPLEEAYPAALVWRTMLSKQGQILPVCYLLILITDSLYAITVYLF